MVPLIREACIVRADGDACLRWLSGEMCALVQMSLHVIELRNIHHLIFKYSLNTYSENYID